MGLEPDKEFLWRLLAAAAGAIVSLSLPGHRDLTARGKLATWLMGFLFAIFIGPAIVAHLFPEQPADSQIVGSIYFLIGLSGMVVVPVIANRAHRLAESWGLTDRKKQL